MAAARIASLGGYDYDFVESPPDDLVCLICTFVARVPVQMDCCGKVYCKACLTEHKKRSFRCPQCRKEGTEFADRRSERHINALRVECRNQNNGCTWVGELASLDKHLDTCKYALLPCPNVCKTNSVKTVLILRKDLPTHLDKECPHRSYQCPHCWEEGKHCDITTSHLETCPQLEIPCPNEGCGEKYSRCDILTHRNTCPFESVACKYSKIGCKDKPLRKKLTDHEKDNQLHLDVAMDTILKREDDVQTCLDKLETEHCCEMREYLKKVEDKILYVSTTAVSPFTFKMSKFSQYIDLKEEFSSPPFYTHQGGYKMQIDCIANGEDEDAGTYISLYAYIMRGENDDNLTWPFTGRIIVELLNQLEDNVHCKYAIVYKEKDNDKYSGRVVDGEVAKTGWGTPEFISHKDLGHKPAFNRQYLKDDTLYFRVSVKNTPNPKPWLACTV